MDRSDADRKRTAHLRQGLGQRNVAPKPSPGQRVSGAARWFITHPWVPLLILGAVLITLWVISTRSEPYQVRAVFAQAPNLYSGENVTVDGLDVGKITGDNYVNGHAVVGVGI